MKGISKKEIEIVSWLEFYQKYFFYSDDVEHFSRNKTQRYNLIKSFLRKKRIVKLNRSKYYLIPINAKSGSWAEHPFIICDEIFNGENYFIGGYAAANYWQIIEQVPMQIDVFTTKRQGKKIILNTKIIFHRTTGKKIKKAITKRINKHKFKILSKEDSYEWVKRRRI